MSSSVRCLRAGVPVVLLLAGILGLSYPAHATRALIPFLYLHQHRSHRSAARQRGVRLQKQSIVMASRSS